MKRTQRGKRFRLKTFNLGDELSNGQKSAEETTTTVPQDRKHRLGKNVPEEHALNEGFWAVLPSHLVNVFFQIRGNKFNVVPVFSGAEPRESS